MNIKIPKTLFGVDGKKALERILAEKDEIPAPDGPTVIQPDNSKITGVYDKIKASTYPKALAELQKLHKAGKCASQPVYLLKDGSILARPLTFSETVRARVTDFNTLTDANGRKRSDSDRRELFKVYFDTSTGIAYKSGSTLFKILPPTEELMGLDAKFSDSYAPVEYSNIKVGIELDSSKGIYNKLLSKQQVIDHPAWKISVNDPALLKEYANLIFSLLNYPAEAMGYWVRSNTDKDELRALALNCLGDLSNAIGCNSLSSDACFVRVNPS